jgi:predicted dehydrogenase
MLRVGVIGCGSHAFRNIYPALQFVPVDLVATCDLDRRRAEVFAGRFGAERSYSDHADMLAVEDLDAVFVVTSADERGRPRYPGFAVDALDAGCNVWIEKPPAATCTEIESMEAAAARNGRHVGVGFKKMFAPANEKARTLCTDDDFGNVSLVRVEYPQRIPTADEMVRFLHAEEPVDGAVGFLDHLCHPMSLLLLLNGAPATLFYERAHNGAGIVIFSYGDGSIAELVCSWGGGWVDGLERTVITSDRGRHVVVDNNLTVVYHRLPFAGYGDVSDFYAAPAGSATAVWRPEFSLGQLYNKGLFVLGYYNELNEFCTAMLEGRPPAKGTLEQAWQVTRVFEAFAEGPGRTIDLGLDRT